MATSRTASAVWTGDLLSGSGVVSANSSLAFNELAVSWKARTEEAESNTSPEELKVALSSMSSGMAVALFTTLTGLVSSILIRLQFQLTSSSIATLINEITFIREDSFGK